MYTFKFISISAIFLLAALAQGAVAQTTDSVPLGGECGSFIGTLPCVSPGKCCYLHPDYGVCLLECPNTTA